MARIRRLYTFEKIFSGIVLRVISKGKAVPLEARRGPEGSRKLRFPDYTTTAQDGGRLSALRTGNYGNGHDMLCLYKR